MPSLVEIRSVVLEKKMTMSNVYSRADIVRQTIREAQLSFQIQLANKSTSRLLKPLIHINH